MNNRLDKNSRVKAIRVMIKNWCISKTKHERNDIWFKNFLKRHGLEKHTKQLTTIKDLTFNVIYALLLATVFKTFFYENFKIPSGSMNPLLLNGDRVLVNKWYYGYSKFSFPFDLAPIKGRIFSKHLPERGDVVVFHTKFSEQNGIFYIKRIIGLPGERIFIKKNQVYINNQKLEYERIGLVPEKSARNHNNFITTEYLEKYNKKEYSILIDDIDTIAGNTYEYIIPDGYYFCMGDNRDNSHDSRFPDFGMIPFENIVGKAERIFFSTANDRVNFDRIFSKIQPEKE